MKIDLKKIILVAAICSPILASAYDVKQVNSSMLHVRSSKIPKLHIVCPKGWKQVFNVSAQPKKWSENSPVVTCKPIKPVMECPQGTYFYIKGNENVDGYNNGEIGCHTPVG